MFNFAESQYFNTLPKMIQESVMQSGISFESENELANFVSNMVNKKEMQ